MPLQKWFNRSEPQPGAPGLRALTVLPDQWREVAQDYAAAGGRLVALWASADEGGTAALRAALLSDRAGLLLSAPIAHPESTYPGVGDLFPAAVRMQRAISDLTGLRSSDPDTRPWLRHAGWPQDYRPLIDAPLHAPIPGEIADPYAFIRVEGDGVHEIAVGPVHAGIIEPGHFRFSVVGEKVLRLEERLAYVHKGIEQRFTQLPILEAHRLAARVSGDSAVAYSWAFCQALEGIASIEIPSRAAWLRALYLELERAANHLGDLGALGNDAGFAFGLTQSQDSRRPSCAPLMTRWGHVTCWMRSSPEVRGRICHAAARPRYDGACARSPMRCRPFGSSTTSTRVCGIDSTAPARLRLNWLLVWDSPGWPVVRAGKPLTCVATCPANPIPNSVRKIERIEGDVAARVAVRFDEVQESCRLVERILEELPEGTHRTPVRVPEEGAIGAGLIEGWRGPVWVALEAGPAGTIRRCHPHDPSWQNWPALEHAIIGNIVPDFPLINKSFNLSYSGHDL